MEARPADVSDPRRLPSPQHHKPPKGATLAASASTHGPVEHAASGLTLATVLLVVSGFFVAATLFFGTKGGYYDTDNYDGNGTAH